MKYLTKNKKHCILRILILLIILSIISLPVSAEDRPAENKLAYCPVCNTEHEFDNFIKLTDFTWSTGVYGGHLFAKTSRTDYDITSILRFDIDDNNAGTTTVYEQIWALGKTVYNSMLSVGTVMVTIYFLLNLMEKVLQDNFTAEYFAKEFIKLTGMLLVIYNGMELIGWGMDLATFIYDKLSSSTSFIGTGTCQKSICETREFWDSIASITSLAFPYLIMTLLQFIVKIIAWTRIINLVVRIMFAPIGMADAIRGGTSSQGFRYFKKIVACSLQGAVILGVSITYNLVKDTISIGSTDFQWLSTVLLAATCVTLIIRASSISEEIMGA